MARHKKESRTGYGTEPAQRVYEFSCKIFSLQRLLFLF